MGIIKKTWAKWLSTSQIIGNFQIQVIFSIFYLLIFSILGIIFRFFSDPLGIKRKTLSKRRSNFMPWEHKQNTIIELRKQF